MKQIWEKTQIYKTEMRKKQQNIHIKIQTISFETKQNKIRMKTNFRHTDFGMVEILKFELK